MNRKQFLKRSLIGLGIIGAGNLTGNQNLVTEDATIFPSHIFNDLKYLSNGDFKRCCNDYPDMLKAIKELKYDSYAIAYIKRENDYVITCISYYIGENDLAEAIDAAINCSMSIPMKNITKKEDIKIFIYRDNENRKSTGCYDKNGREIFEGDSIKGNEETSNIFCSLEKNEIGKICYDENNCEFYIKPSGKLAKTWGKLMCHKLLLGRLEIIA